MLPYNSPLNFNRHFPLVKEYLFYIYRINNDTLEFSCTFLIVIPQLQTITNIPLYHKLIPEVNRCMSIY
jgi:hypothetical protein